MEKLDSLGYQRRLNSAYINESFQNRERFFDFLVSTRNFEISLYWQRSTYFWISSSLLIAIYLAVRYALAGNPPTPSNIHSSFLSYAAFAFSILGIFTSYIWYLANRGSKFWMENWEMHADIFERKLYGQVFTTVLVDPKRYRSNALSSDSVSVTKLSMMLSLSYTALWSLAVFFEYWMNIVVPMQSIVPEAFLIPQSITLAFAFFFALAILGTITKHLTVSKVDERLFEFEDSGQ